jgi:hypothetical protein
MRKVLIIFLTCASVGTVLYAAAVLFVVSKTGFAQSTSMNVRASRNAVVGTVKETVRKVESALSPGMMCLAPLHYAVGTVDARFGIATEDVRADLLKAESIWEDVAKEDMLQYDAQADFKINLVFDDRQKQIIESKKLEQRLNAVQLLKKGISKEYDALSSQYEKKKSRYEDDVKRYNRLASEYEKQVKYWNDNGGASDDDYQRLQQQRKDADVMADDIEKQRKALNALVDQLNVLVKKEKKAVSSYNQDIATYESVYGREKKFDQGVYTGKEINIYQFSAENDLVLVLVHEFGHALRMDHVENPQSIMYYLMSKQDVNHPTLSAEDRQALKNRCL